MNPFNADKTSFGRHETFPLRFGWLAKGYAEWCARGGDPFAEDDAMVTLGVGKNMVRAIRYWLVATQVATLRGSGLTPTEFGKTVIGPSGWDPYLEDDVFAFLLNGSTRVHMKLADGATIDTLAGPQSLQLIPRHSAFAGHWDSAWTYAVLRFDRQFITELALGVQRGDLGFEGLPFAFEDGRAAFDLEFSFHFGGAFPGLLRFSRGASEYSL